MIAVTQLCCGTALPQPNSAIPPNIRAEMTLDRLRQLSPYEITYGIPLPEKQIVGTGYLHTSWRPGAIQLYGSEKMIEGYRLRYDVLLNEIEIRSATSVRVVEGARVRGFVWADSAAAAPEYFINAAAYKTTDGGAVTGFFHVLADGTMPLLKHTTAFIRKANYNVQLNVGRRDDTIVIRHVYYYAAGDRIYPVPSTKKKLLETLGSKSGRVGDFIQINDLDMRDEAHLAKIYAYCNSLN